MILFHPMNPTSCATLITDLLVDLQLRIARRADELSLVQGTANSLNLHCWLVAEYEVFGSDVLVTIQANSPVSHAA